MSGFSPADGPRYAVYAVPRPESALWACACRIIGYDAAVAVPVRQWHPPGIDPADWRAMTEEPRRYGFHGTLKAPFHLAEGFDQAKLLGAVERIARDGACVPAVPLEVAALGRFLALVPAVPAPLLANLAATVVIGLEACRAPMSDHDRRRRLEANLTLRQAALLDAYGYPYVLDEFRFHMTLTGPLEAAAREPVRRAIVAELAVSCPEPVIALDELVVFRQPDRASSFRIIARVRLGSG